jgi:glycosyltransferase involved in cell wall biosynthesis
MIVVINLEQRFERTPDGRVWTPGVAAYPFWQRYLDVFEGVRVVARVRDVASPPPNSPRVDGPGVTVAAISHYVGPWQYLAKARSVHRLVKNALRPEDAVIMRVPSQLANCLFPTMLRQSRPYGVEVVGDPWDVFAPGVVEHPLRPFFRWNFTRQLRTQCHHACAAAYVTQWTLQRRYPTNDGCLNTAYSSVLLSRHRPTPLSVGISDVVLPEKDPTPSWSPSGHVSGVIRLVMVGSLAQLYKGPDVALRALAACVRDGLDVALTIVGDGKFRRQLERQAARLGLKDRVVFRGQLPQSEAVQAELDRSDLFIMPSRTEGLPRAMIEAMARGLPCIGSAIGGIPELLSPEDLVPPGDANALARKIREVVTDVNRMTLMSIRNWRRADDFRDELLKERRRTFCRCVRQRTEEWLQIAREQQRRCA